MEELSMDNILSEIEIDNLFVEREDETQDTPPEKKEEKQEEKTTEVDVNELFASPESVGSEKDKEEKEDTTQQSSTSPKNFYSSFANALKEDGVFPDLDDDEISKIDGAESFSEALEKQIQSRLDEKQQRIDKALNVGVEPSQIRQYENAIAYLDDLKKNEDKVTAEGDEGEKLRSQLIYQDCINRGYSDERAKKIVKRALDNGTDVDDAKDALESNREFFSNKYQELIDQAEEEAEEERAKVKKQAEQLKASILSDKKVFGELELDKATRQKIYDNISRPVYKDDQGNYLTAIQKYERENSNEFLKNVGLLFTLTDGFKNLDALVKGKVKREVKKGLRELEQTINNTSRGSNGNLKFMSGVGDDSESTFMRGWDLDIK